MVMPKIFLGICFWSTGTPEKNDSEQSKQRNLSNKA